MLCSLFAAENTFQGVTLRKRPLLGVVVGGKWSLLGVMVGGKRPLLGVMVGGKRPLLGVIYGRRRVVPLRLPYGK